MGHRNRGADWQQREEGLQAREMLLVYAVASDAVLFLAAQALAFWVRFEVLEPLPWLVTAGHEWLDYGGHYILGTLVWLGLGAWRGHYRPRVVGLLRRSPLGLLEVAVWWLAVYLLVSLVVRFQPEVSRLYVGIAAVLGLNLLALHRWLLAWWLARSGLGGRLRQRVVLSGEGPALEDLAKSMAADPHHPYQLGGRFTRAECERMAEEGWEGVGALEPDLVILDAGEMKDETVLSLAEWCARELVRFTMIPRQFQVMLSGLRLETVSGVPVLGLDQLPIEQMHHRLIKRLLDIAGGLAGLVVCLPVMLVFAWRVRRESPGPVIYSQVRAGRNGRPFRIYKIRSMVPEAEAEGVGWTVQGDPRMLRVGRVMRRWDIDEMPQFWNVLKGDMSLVGPRPERPELIEQFRHRHSYYNLRHGVKPGLTGWAQVHGWRGDTDLRERVRFDFYYLENWSVWLDLYIIFLTLVRLRNAASTSDA